MEVWDRQTFRYYLEGSAIDGDYQIVFTRLEYEEVLSNRKRYAEAVDLLPPLP